MIDIPLLVNDVIKNEHPLNQMYTNTITFDPNEEEEFVDKKREIQGVITDFVVNEYFPQSQDSERFIQFIYSTFDEALKLYRQHYNIDSDSIFFSYKGGNILRYVAYEVMHEIGGKVSDDIYKYYKDAFKKSDADFSIYINPKLANYDMIFDDMNNLAYKLQDGIRTEFVKNKGKYFQFYKYNDNQKTEILRKYLDLLNNTETIKNKLHDYTGKFKALVLDDTSVCIDPKFVPPPYTSDPDFEVDYKHRDKRTILKHTLSTNNLSNMRISSNQTLEFTANKVNIKFSLVRTKVIVNAFINKEDCKDVPKLINLGGELIDVSVPHKNDYAVSHYFEHLKDHVSEYHIKSDTTDFVFKAPSLKYLIKDIELILFKEYDYPWMDVKYSKRIRRLIFLYFITLLIDTKMEYEKKIKYLKFVQTNVFAKLLEMSFMNEPNCKILSDNLNAFIIQSGDEHPPFKALLENLGKVLNGGYNNEEMQKYVKLIYDNVATLITLFESIIQQQHKKGISSNDIGQGSTLWGGSDKYGLKYRKYKNKYLQAKYGP